MTESESLDIIARVKVAWIAAIKSNLEAMAPDERVEFWSEIQDGYCRDCGGHGPGCHCQNDE